MMMNMTNTMTLTLGVVKTLQTTESWPFLNFGPKKNCKINRRHKGELFVTVLDTNNSTAFGLEMFKVLYFWELIIYYEVYTDLVVSSFYGVDQIGS